MSKRILLLIGISLFFAGGFFLRQELHTPSIRWGDQRTYAYSLPELSLEDAAKIPAPFPRQYILGKEPRIISVVDSLSPDDSSWHLIIVSFRSTGNVDETINEYARVLSNTGWDITIREEKNSQLLRAERDLKQLTISAIGQRYDTTVNVTYQYPELQPRP